MRTASDCIPLLALLVCFPIAPTARADQVLEDFEDISDWTGLDQDTQHVQQGSGSGRWDQMEEQTYIRHDFVSPIDASQETFLGLYLYSEQATGAKIQVTLDSEDPGDDTGWDYYSTTLSVDWAGWRYWKVPLEDWSVSRHPLGWDHLNDIRFHASGWGHTPQPGTVLYLDELKLGTGVVDEVVPAHGYRDQDYVYHYHAQLRDPGGTGVTLSTTTLAEQGFTFDMSISPDTVVIPPGGTAHLDVEVLITAEQIATLPALATWRAQVLLIEESGSVDIEEESRAGARESQDSGILDTIDIMAAVPLPDRPSPRLLVEQADFDDILARASSDYWVSNEIQSIVSAADDWPSSYESKYGQATWALPPEGGQWTLYYICPEHSVYLEYQNQQNVCPIDGAAYSGWPYDQVVYSFQHQDLAKTALKLGLAWQFTGSLDYADSAAEILEAYAGVYETYPLHDKYDGEGASAARVLSQTLDEAYWLTQIAWAYDMIADSGVLDTSPDGLVPTHLLQASAATVGRYDAGTSNWQSWHNDGIASVGFALQDFSLVAQALVGSSGFAFQMENSVEGDGFWYEGSWSYHFYALDALRDVAEMGTRGGIDLWSDPALASMYLAPVQVAMPDLMLPAFNDSKTRSLISDDGLYEQAFAHLEDDTLTVPLGHRSRGFDALLWGVDTLPETLSDAPTGSLLLSESGIAVLRSRDRDGMPTYLALDYGPHGGGHGHYDKLGFVSYARGAIMGVDPGTQSYASPYHETWDVTTVAHNTVVVDTVSQSDATGELEDFWVDDDISYVRATAGEAYSSASLARTMVMVPDYVLDRTEVSALDGQAHQIDWAYHNGGTFQSLTPLDIDPYAGLPDSQGYEHLSSPRAAQTGGNLIAAWDMGNPGSIGSPWASPSTVGASMEAIEDPELAHGGAWLARLDYDFSAEDGYIVYGFTTSEPLPDEAPQGITLWIRGDGSGLSIAIRLYDQTSERFVQPLGVVDWTGWREITLQDPETWSNYLGNADGIFDPPLSLVAVQLTRNGSGSVTGSFEVDDITLHYGEDLHYADFEVPARGMRLWTLGVPDTTLVAAEGLGPDLEAVPMVLIRRHAEETTFESLMEFHGATPAVTGFQALTASRAGPGAAGYEVWTTRFDDITLLAGDGGPLPGLGFGDWLFDGAFAWYRQEISGANPVRLVLREASSLQGPGPIPQIDRLTGSGARDDQYAAEDQVDILVSDTTLERFSGRWEDEGTTLVVDLSLEERDSARIRLFAPDVADLEVNGAPTIFSRSGSYITFTWEEDSGSGGCSAADSGNQAGSRGRGGSPSRGGIPAIALGALAWTLALRRRARSAARAPRRR